MKRDVLSAAIKVLVGVCIIGGFLFSSVKVQGYRNNRPLEHMRAEALMVDPTLLKIVSGEFKGLMADYLNLKAAIFKGGAFEVTEEDWRGLSVLFKQSMELDPYFFHTGYYTQGMLSWRKGLEAVAVDILTIQADSRYWDWEPKFYLGFDYFYYLKNNEMGARYLYESSKLPNAPGFTATLAARLMQRTGQTLTAIAFLKSMLESAEDEYIIENLTERLKAHLGVYQLEQARDAFVHQTGRPPETLEELVDAGILAQLPENSMDEGFYYNSDTGAISFEPLQ